MKNPKFVNTCICDRVFDQETKLACIATDLEDRNIQL